MKTRNNMTLQMLLIIILFILLFRLCQPQFYNRRTKCSDNRFIFSVEWANFMMNMQYSSAALNQFFSLLPIGDQIYHYGLKVTQTPYEQANKQKNQCKNFYMHQNICCHYSKIDSLINITIQGYQNSYFQAKFPIVDLIYKIYKQNKKYSTCSNFSAFYLPGIDGYTFSNSTSILSNAISQIQTQINIIQNYQVQQLKNGLCMFCLGVYDFKTFIYPPDPNVNLTKAFLINQNYFVNITKMIAGVMWNISQTANVIKNYILNNLKGNVIGNNSNCSNLQNYVSNTTQMQKRMVCRSLNHCIQFAQTYFGTPGASSYMKVFDNFNRFQNMGVTHNRILLGDNLGFQGNTTYQPYNKTVPPIIADIRGNSYDPFTFS